MRMTSICSGFSYLSEILTCLEMIIQTVERIFLLHRTPVEETNELTEDDMMEVYDYLVKGNLEADEQYKENRRLDTSYEHAGLRFRVNISHTENIPVATLRIIKNFFLFDFLLTFPFFIHINYTFLSLTLSNLIG